MKQNSREGQAGGETDATIQAADWSVDFGVLSAIKDDVGKCGSATAEISFVA